MSLAAKLKGISTSTSKGDGKKKETKVDGKKKETKTRGYLRTPPAPASTSKDDGKKKGTKARGYLKTPPAPASTSKDDIKMKETKVALRSDVLCCSNCAESITVALKELKGVKDVECNVRKKKVVVTCTTAAPADVLNRSSKVFKDARYWTDKDDRVIEDLLGINISAAHH